jgi:hypothetical protein
MPSENCMTTSRILSLTAISLTVAVMAACGSDAKVRKDPNLAEGSQGPQHDYTSTWVYAVGEVDSPTEKDCRKALDFVEAESECVGSVCKYGVNLLKDFEAVCKKRSTPSQRKKAAGLRSSLASRASQPSSDCGKQVDESLERGCGEDGACEPRLRQWATRCSDEIKSPLAMHLLERLVENSSREPRRVRFDVQGCRESQKKLAEAAQCGMPFDCEDALKWVDQYVERCAEGNHTGIPLEQAVQVMRIRFGANKPTEPISIAKSKTGIVSQKGLLAFADGTGAVAHVCDEPVTDLPRYLDQRAKCENGTVTVFMSVENGEGTTLEVRHLQHESDASFTAAHPQMLVKGEAGLRRQAAAP